MHTSEIGILLANLGTPDAASEKAVRRYLAEFLWDKRVISTPGWLWWPILHGVILRTRPKRSAKAYEKVWTDAGSPLLVISREQKQALQEAMHGTPMELGMRYGQPCIADALSALHHSGVSHVVVLPLYPQFSYTTTASIEDAVIGAKSPLTYSMITDYHDHPRYIESVCNSIVEHWQAHQRGEKLLLSFHGIPQNYSDKGDPYRSQCVRTGNLIARQLDLADDQWQIAFQSRLGPMKWLTPYTDKTLENWGKSGVSSIDVVCPGFSTDCLETLEEVAMENRDIFVAAGGQHYQYVPCLNAQPMHTKMLAQLVQEHIHSLPTGS